MADPSNPAPLEDVAVEYITKALQSLGAYAPTTPQLEVVAKTFYKGIYRGLWHFLDDHMFINPIPDKIYVSGTEVEIFNKFITPEDSAWKNP